MIYKDQILTVNMYGETKQLVQIQKIRARALFIEGYTIYLHPNKMVLNNPWQKPHSIVYDCLAYPEGAQEQFEHIINSFNYYTDPELGKYPHYFIELTDLKKSQHDKGNNNTNS